MTLLDERTSPAAKAQPLTPVGLSLSAPTSVDAARPRLHHRRWVVALIIAILSWDMAITRLPNTSIDDSWRFMLQQAVSDGWAFGHRIAFTYGPLVHLDGGPMYSLAGGAASVTVALLLSWATALFVLARCTAAGVGSKEALIASLVLTIVVVPPLRFSETLGLLACSWLLAQLVDGTPSPKAQLLCATLAGVWFSVKPSAAIVVAGAAVCAAAAGPMMDRSYAGTIRNRFALAARRALSTGALAIGVAVVVWLTTGQQLSLLDDYYRGAKEIASGYAEGMAIDPSNPRIEVGFFALAAVLIAVLGRRIVAKRDAQAVFVFLLFVAILVWSRQVALGRPGWSHLKDAGGALILTSLALWPVLGRRLGRVALAVATVLTIGVLLPAPFYQTGSFVSTGPIDLGLSIVELIESDATIDGARSTLAPRMTVGEAIQDRFDAASPDTAVWYYPFLGAGAFVNDTEQWFPPGVQSYASFTNEIEEINVQAITAPDGPDMIVYRRNYVIDEHRPSWESPAQTVSIYCQFDAVAFDRQFTLLERAAATCDTEQLAVDIAVTDRTIPIPAAARRCEGIVTFRLHGAEASASQRLRHLFVRPTRLEVTTGEDTWRFIPGTAAQPHIIAAPAESWWLGHDVPTPADVPSELLLSESFDGRGPLTADIGCSTPATSQDPQ